MKFTRTTYQGSPCWQVKESWLYFDADWNTRFPFGTSLCLRFGRPPELDRKEKIAGYSQNQFHAPGFTLDLNAPLGEPNRLYVWSAGWHAILGLPSFSKLRDTGRTRALRGKELPVYETFTSWKNFHLEGCSRYRYHQDSTGRWVRNDKPDPLHWGWLTIERQKRP